MAAPAAITTEADAIERRVVGILAELLTAEPCAVTPTARLAQDLGADSLDLVEIEFELEDAFGVRFTEGESGEIARCGTAGEVVALVRRKLAELPVAGEAC